MATAQPLYVQYGCGLCAPKEWKNFDASPTLRLQKIPIIGNAFKKISGIPFPKNVLYGDIVKGLPLKKDSCDLLYCSHVLEHLSLLDFRISIQNSFSILKPGGIFRLVMPDLEQMAKSYIKGLENNDSSNAIQFMKNTGMALEKRPRGLKASLSASLGNARHQWLWDRAGTVAELEKAGFIKIRECQFGDSDNQAFKTVEDPDRFLGSIALEAQKPL